MSLPRSHLSQFIFLEYIWRIYWKKFLVARAAYGAMCIMASGK
jgi:hypothetical protein